jgi:hypothetical protein
MNMSFPANKNCFTCSICSIVHVIICIQPIVSQTRNDMVFDKTQFILPLQVWYFCTRLALYLAYALAA